MPHSKQAKKRLRQNLVARERNRSQKSSMKTHIKKVLKAVEEKDLEGAKALLPVAMKKIDKAGKKNLIHKNQASRKIARLSRNVARLEKDKSS